MLEDYIFDDHLRYEGHKLIYTFPKPTEEPIVIGGILGAAILCVRLINTDEQKLRAIVLDERLHYEPFFADYEQEVIGDDWGYLQAELNLLNDAYIQLAASEIGLPDLCPNMRQLTIAMDMVTRYMQHLVVEVFGEHIWEAEPFSEPFAQWLFNAGRTETNRQRFLTTDWTDPAMVHALAEPRNQTNEPTFVFEGEDAADIMRRYWEWLWNAVQREANLYPDAKARIAKSKQLILENETGYDFLLPEINAITPEHARLFDSWMKQWAEFVNTKIKPEKKITFWTKQVTEEQQEALLDYLKLQERQPQRYKCLAVGVYCLRQLGYVTYNIAPASIAKWLSERLQNDYSTGTGLSQFRRAWNDLGRYSPAVTDEIDHLAKCGVKSIT